MYFPNERWHSLERRGEQILLCILPKFFFCTARCIHTLVNVPNQFRARVQSCSIPGCLHSNSNKKCRGLRRKCVEVTFRAEGPRATVTITLKSRVFVAATATCTSEWEWFFARRHGREKAGLTASAFPIEGYRVDTLGEWVGWGRSGCKPVPLCSRTILCTVSSGW